MNLPGFDKQLATRFNQPVPVFFVNDKLIDIPDGAEDGVEILDVLPGFFPFEYFLSQFSGFLRNLPSQK